MANIAAPAQKLMLDWLLGGAAATQPPGRFVGLSLGTPTSVTGSEVQAASGYARQSAQFGAANSPAGSASNNVAMTFGPFSSSAAIQGLGIWDSSNINAGTYLEYGTLLTARTVLPGDSLVIAAGQLIISLA